MAGSQANPNSAKALNLTDASTKHSETDLFKKPIIVLALNIIPVISAMYSKYFRLLATQSVTKTALLNCEAAQSNIDSSQMTCSTFGC